MNSVSIKNSDETIEEYINKLNDITSFDVGRALKFNPSSNIGWGRILFSMIRTFFSIYFLKGKILQGTDGFIAARLVAVHTLVSKAKIWEYKMRQNEGKGLLPPINQKEVDTLERK